MTLSQEFRDILDQLENTRASFFITGKAGTGKSTLLQLFRRTSKKRIAVVAPTGIAALNVRGQTIHSFFKFPPKMLQAHDIHKLKNHRLYKNIDCLIIDEISMVRADMMDNIDLFLRKNRERNEAFGGVQLIVFGDLFQLPPVIASAFERQIFRTQFSSPYFFSSRIIEQEGFELPMIELREVYRQEDRSFIQLLDNIRMNQLDYESFEELQSLSDNPIQDEGIYITLCSVNATVNQINQQKLNELTGYAFEYRAQINGDFRQRVFPTDQILHLKESAQVMFVKNDPDKRFVNGTLGIIKSINQQKIVVAIPDDLQGEKLIDVQPVEWELIKYELDQDNPSQFKSKITGTFSQYPLKLAWAMTIHKSQGKTFDHVMIDLGTGAFDFGQTYVALSRCRTQEGIILKKKLRPRDIKTDPVVVEYYETQKFYW